MTAFVTDEVEAVEGAKQEGHHDSESRPRGERERHVLDEQSRQHAQGQPTDDRSAEEFGTRLVGARLPGALKRLVLADDLLARFEIKATADTQDRLGFQDAGALGTFSLRSSRQIVGTTILVFVGPGLCRPLWRSRGLRASPFDQLDGGLWWRCRRFCLGGRRGFFLAAGLRGYRFLWRRLL